MLSAGFCHLLADSLRKLSFIGRFPITPFLAATGYLITLLADQLVQMLTEEQPSHGDQHQQQYLQLPPEEEQNQHHDQQHLHQHRHSNSDGASGALSSGIKLGQGSNSQQVELSARAVTGSGIGVQVSSLKLDEQHLLPLHHERSNGTSSIHQRSPRSSRRAGQQQQQWEQHGDGWGDDGGWDSGGEECLHRGSGSSGTAGHGIHPEACTQARTVGRVASQVELEVGNHNHHVHFQVGGGGVLGRGSRGGAVRGNPSQRRWQR